jgi:hypothetical protein
MRFTYGRERRKTARCTTANTAPRIRAPESPLPRRSDRVARKTLARKVELRRSVQSIGPIGCRIERIGSRPVRHGASPVAVAHHTT